MRILILKDALIPDKKLTAWQEAWTAFIGPLLGITPTYQVETRDFTDYPTELDTDGTVRASDKWLRSLGADITKRHGALAFDHVILWIHVDHWQSDDGVRRIWGTNFSYTYGNFHLHYCRFDKRNQANTFGTIHHELHHSYDALVRVETGVDVLPLVGVTNWDRDITHGGKNPPWKYTRWKDNTDSIVKIAPHLQAAYAARRQKHEARIAGLKQTYIAKAEELIRFLRSKLHAKTSLDVTK